MTYDNDPAHGGKMTEEMAGERIKQLEDALRAAPQVTEWLLVEDADYEQRTSEWLVDYIRWWCDRRMRVLGSDE